MKSPHVGGWFCLMYLLYVDTQRDRERHPNAHHPPAPNTQKIKWVCPRSHAHTPHTHT